nr:probable protein phosphatase 2C 6 [Setaria viridis]
MSSKSDVPAAAAATETLAWGESPALYVSYGMVADKGMRPALTSAVVAAPSFTVLSPPMGLDYFAVFDGGHLGAAAAVERLRVRLAAAISEQIDGELSSEAPRFGAAAPAHDVVVGWWKTVIQEAFRAVYEEVANDGEDAAVFGATAFVITLVLEKYTVIASSGDSKAVLCRDGEHVELTPAPDERRVNSAQDEKQSLENAASQVFAPTSKLGNFVQITLPSGSSAYNEPPGVVIPELDVVAVERKAQDDEFLILANHGLWGAVPPASACAFVRRRLGKTSRITMPWEAPVDAARGSPAAVLAKELADKALYAGSEDNVSVAIVLFKDFWAQSANK